MKFLLKNAKIYKLGGDGEKKYGASFSSHRGYGGIAHDR